MTNSQNKLTYTEVRAAPSPKLYFPSFRPVWLTNVTRKQWPPWKVKKNWPQETAPPLQPGPSTLTSPPWASTPHQDRLRRPGHLPSRPFQHLQFHRRCRRTRDRQCRRDRTPTSQRKRTKTIRLQTETPCETNLWSVSCENDVCKFHLFVVLISPSVVSGPLFYGYIFFLLRFYSWEGGREGEGTLLIWRSLAGDLTEADKSNDSWGHDIIREGFVYGLISSWKWYNKNMLNFPAFSLSCYKYDLRDLRIMLSW